jgi:hypothetical protein
MAESALPEALIDSPILYSPLNEAARHSRSTDKGSTNEIVESRRTHFAPVLSPKKKGKQPKFDIEWAQDYAETRVKVSRVLMQVDNDRDWHTNESPMSLPSL